MMIGGLKRSSSSLAILAAAGLFAGGVALTPAQAADLGGDCCADLEERVAELEATTVRHANRRVRLTLSGQVNTQVMYWDDDVDSDVYVMDSDEASTRIRLDAVGTISPGLTAGLVIEFDVEIAGGSRIGPLEDDRGVEGSKPDDDGDGIQLRRANWYIDGSLGRLSVGQGSAAQDGAYEVSFSNAWVASVGYGLGVTNIGSFTGRNTGRSWYSLGTDNDQGRINRIRYDTPTFAGFTLSGSWGEDDYYDVAVRYANEFGGLRVAAAAAYTKDKDDNTTVTGAVPEGPGPDGDFGTVGDNVAAVPGVATYTETDTWGGSIAFMFSNIHVEGGYSKATTESQNTGLDTFEREHYWVAAGVQFRGSSLGLTDITVDYIHNDNDTFAAGVLSDTVEYDSYGIGLAQNIDAIGGTAYLSYRHHEADFTFGGAASDDFEQVQLGMRLRY